MAKSDPADEMLDKLLEGKSPEEILGEEGLLDILTKRLVERALEGEMTHHLGYAPQSPAGRHTGNSAPTIRKVIYTTTAIESIQSQLRQVTRNRGAVPNPGAVRKILYLAIERISKKWKRPVRDWVAVLNHFSVVFEGRIRE